MHAVSKHNMLFPDTTCSICVCRAWVIVFQPSFKIQVLHINQPAQTWVLQSKGAFFFSNTVSGIGIVKLV